MTDQNNRPRGDWESPAYVSFITPFCIVRPDNEEDFTVPLDDINQNTYDHGLLCRVVTALPSPLLNTTSLLICADGAIAVPAIPELESINDVLDVINDALCCLLLGGHLCEAIDTRDVVSGNLHECRAIWPTNLGQSLNAHVHSTLRMKVASTMNTIQLSSPKNISVSDFLESYRVGRLILDKIHNLSPTLLLRGFTEMRYGNSVDALSNLWIIVEQLTEFLWTSRFIDDSEKHPDPEIPNRRRSLGKDTRSWSTSIRQEMLYQLGVLPATTYSKIHPARKARNDLVHEGRRPMGGTVEALFDGVLDLIGIASGASPSLLRELEAATRSDFHHRTENDLSDWEKTISQQGGAGQPATRFESK